MNMTLSSIWLSLKIEHGFKSGLDEPEEDNVISDYWADSLLLAGFLTRRKGSGDIGGEQ